MISMEKGSEGHTLHGRAPSERSAAGFSIVDRPTGARTTDLCCIAGGAVTESGEPAWPLAYTFRHGQMRNALLTVCMQLRDARDGDGGFCIVPGSHKANFAVPPALADLADPELNEHVKQV